MAPVRVLVGEDHEVGVVRLAVGGDLLPHLEAEDADEGLHFRVLEQLLAGRVPAVEQLPPDRERAVVPPSHHAEPRDRKVDFHLGILIKLSPSCS